MARQRLGQHFLSDENWREQIAREIGVSRNTSNFSAVAEPQEFCWIEIGGGHGEMTEHLASSGRPVITVELDSPLAKRLQAMAARFPDLSVQHSDILKTDLRTLAAGRGGGRFRNPPAYIHSPLLHPLFSVV